MELGAGAAVPVAARTGLGSIAHQTGRLRRIVGQLPVDSRLEASAVAPVQEVFTLRPLIE